MSCSKGRFSSVFVAFVSLSRLSLSNWWYRNPFFLVFGKSHPTHCRRFYHSQANSTYPEEPHHIRYWQICWSPTVLVFRRRRRRSPHHRRVNLQALITPSHRFRARPSSSTLCRSALSPSRSYPPHQTSLPPRGSSLHRVPHSYHRFPWTSPSSTRTLSFLHRTTFLTRSPRQSSSQSASQLCPRSSPLPSPRRETHPSAKRSHRPHHILIT